MDRKTIRLALVAGTVVFYAFLSLLLAPYMGQHTGVFAVIPVLAGGMMFGMFGGGIAGFAAIPAHAILLNLSGEADGTLITMSDVPGATALVIAGTLVGKLRDLAGIVAYQLSDRQAAHQAVDVLSRENHLLLNAVNEGVIGLDEDARITFANPAAARLLGHSGPELTGGRFADRFPAVPVDEDDLDPGAWVTETIQSGSGVRNKLLLLSCPDGLSFPIEFSVMPVIERDERITGAVVSFSDVRDRIEADRARQQSEDEHRTVVENLTEGITITVGSERVFVNAAFAGIFGISRQEAMSAALGTGALDPHAFAERIREFDANPGRVTFTHRVTRPNGEVRILNTVLVPIDYRGEPARMGLVSDITEQAEAEGAARASDERFRLVFENALEGVAVLDAQGTILESNPALRLMLRSQGPVPAGTMFIDHLNADDAQRFAHLLQDLFAEGTRINSELQLSGRDGEPVWARITGSIVPGEDGAPDTAFIMLGDVSEQKRALEALTESEAKWRSLVEDAPDLIMTAKRDGTLLFSNRGVPGLERSQLVGTSVFDFVPPEYQGVLSSALDRVFVLATPDSYDVRGPRADGSEGWLSVRVSPVMQQGEVVAATIASVDVTGLKRAEEQANRNARELSSLLSISDSLATTGPLKDRVNEALDHVMAVMGADSVALRIRGSRSIELLGARSSLTNHIDYESFLRTNGEFSVQVAESRVAMVINDYESHAGADQAMLDFGFRSMAIVPLMAEEEILGVVTVSSFQAGFFTPDQERLLTGTCDVLSAHLNTERLQAAQESWARQLEAQTNIARILAREESFDQKTIDVLGELLRVTNADWQGLALPDDSVGGLRFVATTGADGAPRSLTTVVPFTDPVCGAAWSHGQTVVYQDSDLPPAGCRALAGDRVGSFVTVPIMGGGQVLGILSAASDAVGHFTDDQIGFLTAVGEGMGTLVEHARLHQELNNQLEEGTRRLEAFRDAAMRLTLERDADQGLKSLLEVATSIADADYGAIVTWDQETGKSKLVGSGPLPEGASRSSILRLLEIARSSGGAIRAQAEADAPEESVLTKVGAFVAIPFESTSVGDGVMGVFSPRHALGFSEADERHVGLFGLLAGIVIDNAALFSSESRERGTLTAIQSSMAEGLIVVDDAGSVKYFNAAAEKLLGLPADRMAGRRLADLLQRFSGSFEDPHQADELIALLEDAEELPAKHEINLVAPSPRDVTVHVFPIGVDKGESLVGLLMRDVTEERALERRRDTFVSVASHELRTPMTTILGFAELLLSRDPAPDVRRSWLSTIYQDSQYVTAIVDDMLNVARIQSGRMHMELEQIDVLAAAAEVAETVQAASPAHIINVLPADEMPLAVADRFKLQQVLTNLAENAIKYSPEGGEVVIGATNDEANHRIVVGVTDSGIGIAPEDEDELFSTFHRIRRPETETIRGTGLGLYIVKALVELMGGEIWLKSRVNSGTTFYFSLATKMPDQIDAAA